MTLTVMAGRDEDPVKLDKLITLYLQLGFKKEEAKKWAKEDLDDYNIKKRLHLKKMRLHLKRGTGC